MRLFDVLGPVMTGPSSSHTAGAVRIGSTARRLLGEQPAQAEILLYGSFAATGRGHGTDRALVAGLLGMQPDDDRIPNSFALAKASGRSDGFFRRRGLRRGRGFGLRGCLGGSIRCGLGRDVVVFLAHLYSSQNPLGVAPSWKNRRQPGPGCTQ